jgi:hypothetical protein
MVNPIELRLNNFVFSPEHNTDMRVFSIYPNYLSLIKTTAIEVSAFDTEYTKLTIDWLIRFGFCKNTGTWYLLDRYAKIDINSIGKFRFWIAGKIIYIDYVHELQNLYFDISKKELKLIK